MKTSNNRVCSFFFTDFPISWSETNLWKMFIKFGKVVDVYIAKKLNNCGNRFGFVRFAEVLEVVSLETKLSTIRIENKPLVVNIARYERSYMAKFQGFHVGSNDKSTKKYSTLNAKNSSFIQVNNHSFADLVRNKEARPKIPQKCSIDHSESKKDVISISSSAAQVKWLKTILVGEPISLEIMKNLQNILFAENYRDVTIKFLGGLTVILDFNNKEKAHEFLSRNSMFWGLPPHAWYTDAFSKVAQIWGSVLIPEDCNFENPNMAIGKVCISTRAKGFINSAICIMIDDKWCNVRVFEDLTEKSNIFPFKPPFADCEKSVDDEVSSEDAGDDAFSGNFPGDKEDQYYPLDNIIDKGCLMVTDCVTRNGLTSVRPCFKKSSNHNHRSKKGIVSYKSTDSPVVYVRRMKKTKSRMNNKRTLKTVKMFDLVRQGGRRKKTSSKEINDSVNIELEADDLNLSDSESNIARVNKRNLATLNTPGLSIDSVSSSNATSVEILKTLEVGCDSGFQMEALEEKLENSISGNGVVLGKSCHFLGIQESMLDDINKFSIPSVWALKRYDFASLNVNGKSGGLISVWNPDIFVKINIVQGDGFLAIVGKWKGVDNLCILVNIYAPQDRLSKLSLWKNLWKLRWSIDGTWIFFGDFNEVRSSEERMSSAFYPSMAANFNNFIHDSDLVDFQIGGRKFTYINSDASKLSKIDRFLASSSFSEIWPIAHVTALPSEFSDHCPLILSTSSSDFGPCPFKFFNSWLNHVELQTIVVSTWSKGDLDNRPDVNLLKKLKAVKFAIKEWRKVENDQSKKRLLDLQQKVDTYVGNYIELM
ncbi:RNA-directed DNA polymerase, eukaryota [Tanacetum coccineum]